MKERWGGGGEGGGGAISWWCKYSTYSTTHFWSEKEYKHTVLKVDTFSLGGCFNFCNLLEQSQLNFAVETVPHSKSGMVPRSSLLGAGQLGSWEVGKGGTIGWRVGQIGSVYKQPETEEYDSCHSWRVPSKWKGVQRGWKGNSKGSKRALERG